MVNAFTSISGSTSNRLRSLSPKGQRILYIAILLLIAGTALRSYLYLSLPSYPLSRHGSSKGETVSSHGKSLGSIKSKYAFVTLLAVDQTRPDQNDLESDLYFIGARTLAYQILHAPETRSDGIPLIVLCVAGTPESKKSRLRKDGAVVLDIAEVPLPAWIPSAENPKWANMFDKLRVWELTQFERIVFMDTDVLLTRPLTGAFESATLRQSKASLGLSDNDSGTSPPGDYVFAAGLEPNVDHHFPPTLDGGDFERGEYVNAGFFITKPSMEMFNYYLAAMSKPDSFSTEFREQDLLNHVHRLDGSMPWEQLDPIWNMHRPMQSDIDGGTHSVHAKWWNAHHRDLMPYLASWRWRMQGYFEAMDEFS